jgi:hypothetical protein
LSEACDLIAYSAPTALDDELGLTQRVEDFTVKQLIAQARVELSM